MAIFRLNIGAAPKKVTGKAGKEFWTFPAAENQGENRKPLWLEVIYFPEDPLDGELLSVGQYIEVTGRLDPQVAIDKAGVPVKDKTGKHIVNLKLVTGKITPIVRREQSAAE